MTDHGAPCWYELSTTPGKLGEAGAFYAKVLGWTFADAGMDGFDYRLASIDGAMVAGAMDMPADAAGMPPMWLVYFAVDDADRAVAQMAAAGARVHRPVTPIPGTGRFAVLGDPQGAGFGILEPAPMPGGGGAEGGADDGADGGAGRAFDQKKAGHGNWHELATTDPRAAMAFYTGAFGWRPSRSMDMGEMGSYDLFARNGADIGGMMRLQPGGAPAPHWLPYFGANGIDLAIARIKAAGGSVLHGPAEVPGGAFIAVARDPEGAQFAVVGPKETTS
ncbi:VOC family protein [Albidovulum sp.]|jgi:predicted enzyme related to lactoylglutathione lyase|uniref:VOC family protein n=1 Tax=Albidovulum sp. TaxID=1872424 RepID=UPI0030554B51